MTKQSLLWTTALVLVVGMWASVSYFEAQAYNSATGANVSTWEAMWITLRVEGAPKCD